MSSLANWVAQALVAAFLAILFLQSGLDKVLDWQGNKGYVTGYFEKSPLRRFSTLLLFVITLMEVGTGILCAAGVCAVVLMRDSTVAFFGSVLGAASILSLFFGQRLAKDYAAAAGIVPYFIVTLAGVIIEGGR